jgi:membrane associated rhomboid family serine protease
MREITPVVKQLLIINIIFYIGSQIVPVSYDLFALHYFENPNFRFWQPLTHMFMHAKLPDFSHILFNMFGLFSFGTALEQYWGGKRFLFFYIICGLGAALAHVGVSYFEIHNLMGKIAHLGLNPSELNQILNTNLNSIFDGSGKMLLNSPVGSILKRVQCNQDDFNLISEASMQFQGTAVGASGAIYGIIVAFAFMFPEAQLAMYFIPIPIKAKYFVPMIVAYDLVSGISGNSIFGSGNTAHFAHVGGAFCGLLLMLFWRNRKFKQDRWN